MTDSLASAVAIAAYEPHGTVVPKLFSTLYDGADRPCFFRSAEQLPCWGFALSLQKKARLSEAAELYIRLFIRYIHTLGLLVPGMSEQAFVELAKQFHLPDTEEVTL